MSKEKKDSNGTAIESAMKTLADNSRETLGAGFSVNSVDLEIHAAKTFHAVLTESILDRNAAQKIDDFEGQESQSQQALRMKDTDHSIRLSLHSPNAQVISAEAELQQGEMAFLEMYLRYDQSGRTVTIETNVEVADNYEGMDLQGYGLGSAFSSSKAATINSPVISAVRSLYPEAESVLFSIRDIARGKGDKSRTGWTTNLVKKAGFREHGSSLVKTIDLT